MQSRKQSITESCLNVFSGMVIAFILSQLAALYEVEIQKYVWSGFVWKLSAGSNALMTTILTFVSVIRGYAWRRHFNNKQVDVNTGLLQQISKRGGLFKKETKK